MLEMLLESWEGSDTPEEKAVLLCRRDKELERAEKLAEELVSLGNLAEAKKLFKSSLNCREKMSGHEGATVGSPSPVTAPCSALRP
jgi:hypothetical protein